MYRKIFYIIFIFLASCSILNHAKHDYTGTFKVATLRDLWMACYQRGVSQMALPPIVARGCDCYVDSIRVEFREKDISDEDFMEKNRGKTGKLAAACLSQTQGVYPSAPNKSST